MKRFLKGVLALAVLTVFLSGLAICQKDPKIPSVDFPNPFTIFTTGVLDTTLAVGFCCVLIVVWLLRKN